MSAPAPNSAPAPASAPSHKQRPARTLAELAAQAPLTAEAAELLSGVADANSQPQTAPGLTPVLDAAFPAPTPVMIRTSKLRSVGGNGAKFRGYSVCVTVPKDIMRMCQWRAGDALLLEAWADGTVRIRLAGRGI